MCPLCLKLLAAACWCQSAMVLVSTMRPRHLTVLLHHPHNLPNQHWLHFTLQHIYFPFLQFTLNIWFHCVFCVCNCVKCLFAIQYTVLKANPGPLGVLVLKGGRSSWLTPFKNQMSLLAFLPSYQISQVEMRRTMYLYMPFISHRQKTWITPSANKVGESRGWNYTAYSELSIYLNYCCQYLYLYAYTTTFY